MVTDINITGFPIGTGNTAFECAIAACLPEYINCSDVNITDTELIPVDIGRRRLLRSELRRLETEISGIFDIDITYTVTVTTEGSVEKLEELISEMITALEEQINNGNLSYWLQFYAVESDIDQYKFAYVESNTSLSDSEAIYISVSTDLPTAAPTPQPSTSESSGSSGSSFVNSAGFIVLVVVVVVGLLVFIAVGGSVMYTRRTKQKEEERYSQLEISRVEAADSVKDIDDLWRVSEEEAIEWRASEADEAIFQDRASIASFGMNPERRSIGADYTRASIATTRESKEVN